MHVHSVPAVLDAFTPASRNVRGPIRFPRMEALESFNGSVVADIVIFPLFMERGMQVNEDIPGMPGLGEGRKQGTYNGFNVIYADPLGADDLLACLVCKRIKVACDK